MVTPNQWIVLDNLRQGWPYKSNLSIAAAEEAYLWLVRNEYIKDGKLTSAAIAALATGPKEGGGK